MPQDYTDTTSYYIVQIAKLHRQMISDEFAKLGIFVGQDMILRLLWEEDGLTQTQIINQLKVEPPTITKMIHRMEKTGLLKRRRDPKDARVSRIFLTERGFELKGPITQVWNDMEDRLVQGMPDEEQSRLRTILQGLLSNLR